MGEGRYLGLRSSLPAGLSQPGFSANLGSVLCPTAMRSSQIGRDSLGSVGHLPDVVVAGIGEQHQGDGVGAAQSKRKPLKAVQRLSGDLSTQS